MQMARVFLSVAVLLFSSVAFGAMDSPAAFMRGRVNTDENLDIADAVCLLSYLFGPQDDPCKDSVSQCLDAADANDDGTVDIADAVALLSHLFASSGDLPPPFDVCDMDPTADELDCVSFVACKVEVEEITTLWLDTAGGFTGAGSTDYRLKDDSLAVYIPFADPPECSLPLTQEQRVRLLEAASAVKWDAVRSSYRPPQNPDCCCDQITSDFTITLVIQGETLTVDTEWCDESFALVPADLLAFLDVLATVGAEVREGCS